MNLRSSSIWVISCLVVASFHGLHAQGQQVNTSTPAEAIYVIIQLKPFDPGLDSVSRQTVIKASVDQIKAANARLGYAEFEKKVASFSLIESSGTIPYLTIRPFTGMSDADQYAQSIGKLLPRKFFGSLKAPFPVTQSAYRKGIEQNSFRS